MENSSNTEIALYIDIEGFSNKFETGGKQAIINLTNVIYQLGRNFFDHLLIIQFGGDGFLIKENVIYKNKIKKFVDLAVILLQSITISGGAGRVQISFGSMTDIRGSFSEEIRIKLKENDPDILRGRNFNKMIINPTIGRSIINCYNLQGPKGPLLLIDKNLGGKLIAENISFNKYQLPTNEVIHINWIKYSNEKTQKILSNLDLNSDNIEEKLKNYIDQNQFDEEWTKYALQLFES